MTPFLAELIGTMFLILLGEGVVANSVLNKTKGHNAGIISIATSWGLGVFAGVVVAGPYSGAHLNPAVTLGFAVAGSFPWSGVLPYISAQMIGAAIGAILVWLVYKDHFKASADPAGIKDVFCTSPAIRNYPVNFLTEVIGTFTLMFLILYITGAGFTLGGTTTEIPVGLGSVGAIPVALVVFVIGLSLGGPTGYAINPARDLAPRVMHSVLPIANKGDSDWRYAWVPVLGPLTGGVIAACLYLILQ